LEKANDLQKIIHDLDVNSVLRKIGEIEEDLAARNEFIKEFK
jgi:hypothetical protein